ncbi:MAG: sulfite exporter TauE/SafE family protein [Cyanobacteria bacterium P01_F01_bin.150]
MWDLVLIFSLGFLGSFGHCVGMCGPLTVALALSQQSESAGKSSKRNNRNTNDSSTNSSPANSSPANNNVISTENPSPASIKLPDCTCDSETSNPPLASSLPNSLSASSPSLALASPASSPAPPLPSSTPLLSHSRWAQIRFHLLLNLGRLISYVLIGGTIGAIGSVLVASGQVAGVGSGFRRSITIFTGLLLMWFGVAKINPTALPKIPFVNPMHSKGLHERLQETMSRLSLGTYIWTPFLLGLVWGLIPCGFLYAAQIKAAETASFWWGGATLFAFGLGTVPSMVGIGLVSTWLGRDRRNQLFRAGGWMTLLIGILMVLRTGDQMVDYSGHGALICLILSLIARPISRVWKGPRQYRRALGVGAFVLAIVHILHTLEHSWGWKLQALFFMLPQHQVGVGFGLGGVALMTPLMFTSFDWAQKRMKQHWRRLHLLAVPALALAVTHCMLVGSNYLGRAQITWVNGLMISTLSLAVLAVGVTRSPFAWRLLSLEKWYVPPRK